MKVHTKVVYQMTPEGMDKVEDEFYDYEGPVEECKGGGEKTITTDVPEYLKPYLQNIAGEASSWIGQQPAGVTGAQQQAVAQKLQLAQDQLAQGNPNINAAIQNNLQTARGDMLFGGPGFNAAMGAAQRQIMPAVSSRFAQSGRGGGGLESVAQTQAMSDAFAKLYNEERGRQMQAGAMAPDFAQMQYMPADTLFNVGAQQQQLQDYRQQARLGQLGQIAGIINPQAGMGGAQRTPLTSNPAAGAMGGAMTGYMLGGGAGSAGAGAGAAAGAKTGSAGGWWGAAIGGILGALAS